MIDNSVDKMWYCKYSIRYVWRVWMGGLLLTYPIVLSLPLANSLVSTILSP